MSSARTHEYSSPSYEALHSRYVGKNIESISAPAAVLDRAKAERNCDLMLEAVKELRVSFRAHVKTHKTTQLTRLQVGQHCKDVRLIVSTVAEAEQLIPLLQDYKASGAEVNVLYGVPLPASQVTRLAEVGKALGQGSIAIMIDHPSQLRFARDFRMAAGFPAQVFVKVDSGTHRAGLSPESESMAILLSRIADADSSGDLVFLGYYSHAGHSYGGSSPGEAMSMLKHEIEVCHDTAERAPKGAFGRKLLTVSVGASPTTMSVQNLHRADQHTTSAKALHDVLVAERQNFEIELHAGAYPLLDMQQIAAQPRTLPGEPHDAIALTVLAEVCSSYPERQPPEALIAAGCLALAREPCKDYKGWGRVSPWNVGKERFENKALIIKRISQEHGIVAFEFNIAGVPIPLTYGQKIRIWPNHACITSAMYDWYVVVDSSSDDPDQVRDIWMRWRGW